MFITERGGPMTADALNRMVKRLGGGPKRFGFPIHMIRQACGFKLEGTSTASLSSVSISEFRFIAALIVAEHQASLPLADMSSMLALMAEKKTSSAPFRPIRTIAAATLAIRGALPIFRYRRKLHRMNLPKLGRLGE